MLKCVTRALLPVIFALAPALAQTRSLEGEWKATLDTGGNKLRLALKVAKAADGNLAATIDSLDQGAGGIPVAEIAHTGDDVKLILKVIAASYEGRLNAAGTAIEGKWNQGGAILPLTFQREAKPAEGDKKFSDGLPAPLSGFQDEGTFLLFVNEERLGVMSFNWKPDGSLESNATISMAGQSRSTSARLTLDEEGR